MHFYLQERFSYQKGQALLIMVLVMVVMLTVGLSLASRTIFQTKTATEEADSQRAFDAAEAGIERILAAPTGIPLGSGISLGNSATIQQVAIQQLQGTQILVNNGNPVKQNEGNDIW